MNSDDLSVMHHRREFRIICLILLWGLFFFRFDEWKLRPRLLLRADGLAHRGDAVQHLCHGVGRDEHDPDPTFERLFIYTREVPSEAEVRALTDRARALGYDVSRLEFPALPRR